MYIMEDYVDILHFQYGHINEIEELFICVKKK